MRSILAFLWKNNFIILFLVLELVSVSLVVKNNKYHNASFINSANSMTGGLLQWQNNFSGYVGLKEDNLALAQENMRLHAQSVLSFAKYTKKEFVLNDTIYKQQYTFLNAQVINNSIYKRNNYLTLNKGAAQGIAPEMGVVASNGIIGIVKDVSDNFCTVLSVLHKNSSISARLEGKVYFGSLIWNGKDFKYGTLKEIPSHVILTKGIKVVSSGHSAIFPQGIPIGTIVDYEVVPGDNSYTIKIKFAEDYSDLAHVYVVSNLMRSEQVELESRQFDY